MTALSARQMNWLHDELGDPPTDAELQTVFDTRGTVRDTAVVFIRRRITALTNQPLTVGISGVANFGFGENIKALERQLARLLKMDDDPSDDPAGGDEDADALPVIQVREFPRRRRR